MHILQPFYYFVDLLSIFMKLADFSTGQGATRKARILVGGALALIAGPIYTESAALKIPLLP